MSALAKRKANWYDLTSSPVYKTTRARKYTAKIYKMPSRKTAEQTYKFSRQLQQVMTITQNGGWANAGFDMAIFPALTACDISISGTLVFQPVLPSSSDFGNLFDMYRITRVHCEIIYSGNDNNTTTPTYVLPVIHIMNDYNSAGSLALTDYEQHPEVKTYQLGVGRKVKWSFVPRTRGDLLTNSGLTSTSANNKPYQWIDTSSPNVQMLGTRAYFNNFGRNVVTDIGSIILTVRYDMEFKFVK